MMRTRFVLLILLLILSSCATLSPNFEQPSVSVSSFRLLPSNSVVPRFEIGLHVINPNRTALQLVGMTYHVELEGYRVLTGVASDLPLITAYGEGEVLLQASPDLFSSISLFTDLLNQPRETVSFNLTAWLDVGKFLPRLRVEKAGEISFPVKNR